MVMPAVSYAKSEDGVHLAFARLGSGSPVVITGGPMLSCQPNVITNPKAFAFLKMLADQHELILIDERGTGSSGGDIDSRTAATDANDIQAVVRAAGLAKVCIFSAFSSTPAALEWAAAHSERVDRVVLWSPTQRPADIFESEEARAILGLCEVDPDLAFRVMIHTLAGWGAGLTGPWLTELLKESLGIRGANQLLRRLEISDDVLAQVQADVLVMHPSRSRLLDVEKARQLTASIPNAHMMLVDAESISPYAEDIEGTAYSVLDALNTTPGRFEPPATRRWGENFDAAPAHTDSLTPRERDVLRLIAQGDSSKEIGARLEISVNTVDRHISNIYRKLGVRGRAQAAAYAVKQGIG
jgi:DNA-binding CsgD family transcriptional regulator/pimeloyl-ACP methyl ester carboxylesterase